MLVNWHRKRKSRSKHDIIYLDGNFFSVTLALSGRGRCLDGGLVLNSTTRFGDGRYGSGFSHRSGDCSGGHWLLTDRLASAHFCDTSSTVL